MVKQFKFLTCILVVLLIFTACTTSESEPDPVAPEVDQPEALATVTLAPTSDVEIESVPTNTSEPMPTETAIPSVENNYPAFSLDEPFSLGGGETAVLDTGNLQLTFAEVVEDSRCPEDVDCFWSGQAIIRVLAEQSGQPSVELLFNTNPAPNETVDTLPAYEYIVHLEQLDPYPAEVDNPIVFEEYQAQLVVTQP